MYYQQPGTPYGYNYGLPYSMGTNPYTMPGYGMTYGMPYGYGTMTPGMGMYGVGMPGMYGAPTSANMLRFTDIIYKIPFPTAKPKKNFVCVWNAHKQKVCQYTSPDNIIECEKQRPDTPTDQLLCRVNYRTDNKAVTKAPLPQGTGINLEHNNAFPTYYVFGTFPKSDLRNVNEALGNRVPYREVDRIEVSLGLPDPPTRCGWLWWKDECRPYSQSPDWVWGLISKKPFLILRRKEK